MNTLAVLVGPQLSEADPVTQHRTDIQLASFVLPAKQLVTLSRPTDRGSFQGQPGGKQLLGMNGPEKSA